MTLLMEAAADGSPSAVRALESLFALRGPGLGMPEAGAAQAGAPVSFQFRWRGRRFVASMVNGARGTARLAVTAHVADGGTAPCDGASMVVAIATDGDGSLAELTLIRGTEALVRERFAIDGAASLSVDGLVARLTGVVLHAAPYLDLMSEAQPEG